MDNCVFCKMVKGDIPTVAVYEDDYVRAILDIRPASLGHVLLIPKEHAMVLPQCSENTTRALARATKLLSTALLRTKNIEGTSVFIANGELAGQRAPHVLVHIIPRETDDNISLDLPQTDVSDDKRAFLEEQLTNVLKGNHLPTQPDSTQSPKPEQTPKDTKPKEEDVPKDDNTDYEGKEIPEGADLDAIARLLG